MRLSKIIGWQLAVVIAFSNCMVNKPNSQLSFSYSHFSEQEVSVYKEMVDFFSKNSQHDSLLARNCCYGWVNDSTTNKFQAFPISPEIYNFFDKKKTFNYVLKQYQNSNKQSYFITQNIWQNNLASKERLQITFSRVGFNNDSSLAMLYAEEEIKSLWGGNGAIYILENIEGNWKVKKIDYLWLR